MSEYLGIFENFKTEEKKSFIFEADNDKEAAAKCRAQFGIKGGRVDYIAGYINHKLDEWLISFTERSLLKPSVWDQHVRFIAFASILK